MSASRSFLSQANRNVTARCWPHWRVDGAAPARQASDSGVGKRSRTVADLGQQGRRPDLARPGQAPEDPPVGMERELLGDPALELGDLLADGQERPDERERDRRPGVGPRAGQPDWGGLEAPAELLGARPAAVPLAPEPGRYPLRAQPGGLGSRREAEQEPQGDRRVKVGEQPDGAREGQLELGPELLGEAGPRPHEVLAGPDGRPQGDGLRPVGPERPEPVSVGPQHVGEDERVPVIVLVAGRPIAGPERLHVAAGDDHDLEPGGEQGVDDRAVRALDRDPLDIGLGQSPAERPQSWLGVLDLEPLERGTVLVDDAHRVAPGRPVDACVAGERIHPCLLAGPLSLGAPSCSGRVRRSLTDRRSMARSPIAALHVPGRRTPRNSAWSSSDERGWRWSGVHQGCVLGHSTGDAPMVLQ